MSELPNGWAKVELAEIGDWGSGGTPKRTNSQFYSNGTIPWLVIGDLNNGIVTTAKTCITEEGLLNSSAKLLPPNTLLIAMYGSIGKLGITGVECATNQAIAFCAPNPKIIRLRYLFNALKYFKDELNLQGKGVAQKNISQNILKTFLIPVAPLNEQKRIADKLDNLLTRVDECRDRLTRIEKILQRLRHSILGFAAFGKITSDWREPKLLRKDEDIDNETLPAGWEWKLIREVGSIQLGRQRAPRYHSGQHMRPYLRVQNVFEDKIDLSDVMEMDFPPEDFEKYQLTYGDILLNEGQSPEFLGRPAMYRDELPGVCFTNTLIRFQAFDVVNRDFALLVFRHYMHSGRFSREGKITTNIAHLSAGRFSEIEFPVPSLDEQQEIVNRAKALFAFADLFESKYRNAVSALDKITSSILTKAFRGDLAEQDPSEESVLALLKKVQLERTTKPTKVLSNRRSKMPKLTEKYVKEVISQLPKEGFSFTELRDKLSGDYDVVKDILFSLLDKSEQEGIMQVLDRESEVMKFTRREQ